MTYTAVEMSTPLGVLLFGVSTGRLITKEDWLTVMAFDLEAKLPSKMTVEESKAVFFEIVPGISLSDLVIEFVFQDLPAVGSPETGEALDAQAWESGQHIVMIGTEDVDFLSRRLPSLNLSDDELPTEFLANGFRITLTKLEAMIPLSLHFVVASNPLPDATESTWFAVDVPHARIAGQAKETTSSWSPMADPLRVCMDHHNSNPVLH